MGHGDIHGKARVNPRRPRAFAVDDFSGGWTNHHRLIRQMEWQGTALVWTGMLVSPEYADKPQPQLRAIRLPPDPIPIPNPRPENFQAIDMPLGFTQYVMWPQGQPLLYTVILTDGNGNPIVDNFGNEIIIEIGADGPALLAQLAQMTGIPVPGTIETFNGNIATVGVSQTMIPAAARSYIAIFNPCLNPIWVNLDAAASSTPGTASITLGCGGCLFWATAQGYQTPTAQEITVLGWTPNAAYYAYSAP